jgi:amino acid adenylation domain-containing protein
VDLKNVEAIYPLSPAQEHLLLRGARAFGAGASCGQFAGTLRGELDVAAFEQAWQEVVVSGCAVARTFFVWKRVEKPAQVVRKQLEFAITQQDWRDLSPAERQARLADFLRADFERGFDPSSAPLVRVSLCRMADDEQLFVCTYHRLVLDRESLSLILEDVFNCYDGLRQGQRLNSQARRPYRDFVAHLEGREQRAQDEFFWRHMLEGIGTPTMLAAESAPEELTVHEAVFKQQELFLSEGASIALSSLARRHQLTLDTLVVGAWALLLSRYSGAEEVLFGVTESGRPPELKGVETIAGSFLHTLPLRVRTPRAARLLPWLGQLQQSLEERRQHQYVQLAQVQQWSDVPQESPLFESRVLVGASPVSSSRAESGGLLCCEEVRFIEPDEVALTIRMRTGSELILEATYDARRFEAAAVRRMLEHLRYLLENLYALPEQCLGELPLLPPQTLHQLLVEWNDTRTIYPREQTIQQLFEQQVEQTPDALAVEFGDERLSYRELNRRANQLAHYLRKLGVRSEVSVGLCLERSAEMIVALIGILKAGGAYVPLDMSYPLERLAFMMEDAQIPVLLTSDHLSDALPAHWGEVVCIDTDREVVAEESEENPASSTNADNLAYIMYTSGSTGTPKGVSVTHRNVVRLVKESDYVEFGPDEVFLQLAPVSFDASTFEIWGSLLNGSRLVVMPPHTPSLEELGATLRRCEVTTLWLTAGLFNLMVGERLHELKEVRQLLAGGDVLSVPRVQAVLQNLHGGKLVNGYGPTESTTFACCYPMNAETQLNSSVPIGRPISNTQIYLLNRNLQPVPVGLAGELYIGGDGVARAYHNRPELTAERFVPHPFATEPGARLYRTGDLARYRQDGVIEFIGRRDYQVKVRGFRIELEEIEAVLAQHPSVQQVVVAAHEDSPGEKQLVAYVVASKDESLSSGEMRAYLKERLPAYMIPAHLMRLETLPLTPNGKVDRRALPPPTVATAAIEDAFVAPSTPAELVLAEAWKQVLGLEQVGINDNFFDLGGDSIRSIQLRAVVQMLGYDFSIQQLFQQQTISEMAQVLVAYTETSPSYSDSRPFSLVEAIDRNRLPEDVEDAYPLARLQLGMLFHSELSDEESVYHDIFSFHLRTPLDSNALRAALRQLIERHPMLRTAFDLTTYSEPLQLVQRTLEPPLSVIDLRHLTTSEQEEQLTVWMESEKQRHFDWKRPPYFRFLLFLRGADTFQFAVSFHHALLDGWSVASMLTELFTLYYTQLDHTRPPAVFSPLTTTYRTFVMLEREAIESEEGRRYWSEKLDECPVTMLPRWPLGVPPAPEKLVFEKRFSAEFVSELKTLARLAGATLKSVLLAAHLRVLGLISGNTEVTTGVVFNGRPESEDSERVLGLFLNTLPFSLRLSGGTWIDLVSTVQRIESEMTPFRRYPLAELQKMNGGQPLFETAFNFVHFHVMQALQKFEHLLVLDTNSHGKTNFPFIVSFALSPETSECVMKIEYDTAKLCEEQINRIGNYFARTLQAMARTPHARYETTQLLSETERRQLLSEWNETHTDYASGLCLHQLFEAQARRTPDAVAIRSDWGTLTYAELDAQAETLARYLRQRGVRAETLVGVCLERTPHLVVGLLGVLKAGGAYLPLDPAYPRERLRVMVSDAQARYLLTQESVRALAQWAGEAAGGVEVISLDGQWAQIVAAVDGESGATKGDGRPTLAGQLAYVIYTSGSTGRPKGAMLTHEGVVNCLCWMQETYRLDETDSFLMKTSLNFDPSVWEIFWPLWIGAQVVLAPPGAHLDPTSLVATIARYGVTSVYFVPSMLELFLKTPGIEQTNTLRRVICGGEKLSNETIDRFFQVMQAELHHSYGPTETSIAASEWRCERDGEERLVTIGRPLANTQLYVLDAFRQPVPVSVPGELYIGGIGVGRGYLHRPDLTAESFLPDPFSDEPGARLYRTGDLVRYLPDGRIEFLGRLDWQVKMRGYRIELGEVEAVLQEHEGVRECVVVAREDAPGAQRLVAYAVSAATDSAPSSVELRAYLKERLPEYMVPALVVMLDALPLMTNGKIDRRLLPPPEMRTETEESYAMPRTPVEELLAGLWGDVLGLGRVSVHDDFFELGGNSLLATQLVSRVREALRVEMPLRELFEHPTVRSLAGMLEQSEVNGLEEAERPPLVPISRDGLLPLSFAQQRLWFLYQIEPETSAYNIPAVVHLSGALDVAVLEQTLYEIVRRHESLRTTFTIVNGVPQQVVSPVQQMRLPVTDLSWFDQDEREEPTQQLVLEEVRRPFDLERGPVLRVSLLRLAEQEHVLVMVMHHIVSDAWSLNVLIREMSVLYESFAHGQPSPLPEPIIQYADFAHWQRLWLSGEVMDKQLAYWKQQLGARMPVLDLPTDMPPSAVQSFRGRAQKFNSLAALTEPLKALSQREGATLFMTLLAAFKTLLHYYAGQPEIVVGATLAGRNYAAIENLIGFFVNAVVMRTKMTGDPTFRDLIGRVREVSLGAYAHQDVPFDKLLAGFRSGRDGTRNPLEVAFTFDNTPQETVELSGLTLKVLETGIETTRHNLVLALTDTPHGLTGSFQYNTDLFNASTIARMIAHYELLLRSIIAQPDARLSELRKLLDEADQQQQEARQNELKAARSRMLQTARMKLTRQSTEGELAQ